MDYILNFVFFYAHRFFENDINAQPNWVSPDVMVVGRKMHFTLDECVLNNSPEKPVGTCAIKSRNNETIQVRIITKKE